MRKKLQELLTQYGPVAAVTWFTIFFIAWIGFALALQLGFQTQSVVDFFARFGFDTSGAGAKTGVWLTAYGLTKLTQPLRIALWLLVTPLASKLWNRLRGRPHVPPGTPGNTGAPTPPAGGL